MGRVLEAGSRFIGIEAKFGFLESSQTFAERRRSQKNGVRKMELPRFAQIRGDGVYYVSDRIFLTSSERKIGSGFSADYARLTLRGDSAFAKALAHRIDQGQAREQWRAWFAQLCARIALPGQGGRQGNGVFPAIRTFARLARCMRMLSP